MKARLVFILGYFVYMGLGHMVSAKSQASQAALQERIETVREMTLVNSGKLGIIEEKVRQNSEDIKSLIQANKETAAALNRYSAVGTAFSVIAAIIVIVDKLRKGRDSNA